MKIAAIQLKPTTGDINTNITRHITFIESAVNNGADLVFFPELSITAYDSSLAKSLATEVSDPAFDVFQKLSDTHSIIIGIGVSFATEHKPQIGMIWFAPNKPRTSYAKQLLHADEFPFFSTGDQQLILQKEDYRLAPAVCYESLQSSHCEAAANLGTNVYLASVAKSEGGIAKGMQHYPEVAKQHNMHVVLVNSIGPCDDFMSAGQSAAWNPNGELLAQLDSDSEGILMVDLANNHTTVTAFS